MNKIVICSLAGSVGKTTVTAHMLCPRMPDARIIAVDTANATVEHFGIKADVYSGEEFTKLYKQLVRMEKVIIDVGGSKEGKDFLIGMMALDGHDEIDAFIIPAMSDDKDQKAAVRTIELLLEQGVEKHKIKVIFNAVQKSVADEFDHLCGFLHAEKIPHSFDSAIFKHDIYNVLSVQKRSLESIMNDKRDYKAAVRALESDDDDEISKLTDLMVAQKSAPRVNANLDTVFKSLFPQ